MYYDLSFISLFLPRNFYYIPWRQLASKADFNWSRTHSHGHATESHLVLHSLLVLYFIGSKKNDKAHYVILCICA